MESAKAAINSIVGRGGTHDTIVDETVNAPVTSETVKPTRHEETTQAIDKEVHKDHYHTTVQPLADRQVLPEQHTHQAMPVQEREFVHGDSSAVKEGVQAELGQFRNTTQVAPTQVSASQGGTVAGEHIHHHVYEQVQPVVHKETIQPEVVHTTIPIHERHQAPSEHHGMSVMPVKPLSEFEQGGTVLSGSSQRHEQYEGDPRRYDSSMQVERHDVDVHPEQHDGLHSEKHAGSGTAAAVGTGAGIGSTTTSSTAGTGLTGSHQTESTSRGLGDTPGHNLTTGATGATADGSTLGTSSTHTSSHHHHHKQHHDTDSAHTGQEHQEGHGISNQQHHGSSLDNTTRDDSVQHGDQPRDPAVVDDKTDKKLTGTGVDGSHSAVFGLTPDGHKHTDTKHGSTPSKPAHGGEPVTSEREKGAGGETVADQMVDPRVAEKGHGGDAVSATGGGKPGAGLPTEAGSQGLGEVRPQEHGAESKLKDKIDPTTDADGDGKKGVMD